MGAWSPKTFGNDAALDMALDLNAAPSLSKFKARLTSALQSYEQFDVRRDRGENKEIWTTEYVEWMLSHFQAPIGADVERVLREGIGKEHLDSGSDAAFEAIAAGAITLAAYRREIDKLADDVHTPLLGRYKPTLQGIRKAMHVLRLIPKNKELCRDCGATWKKHVLKLADELAACEVELAKHA